MGTIHFAIVSRLNTRACTYTQKSLMAALGRVNCEVTREETPKLIPCAVLHVREQVQGEQEALHRRGEIETAIRRVHVRVPYRFEWESDR